MDIQQMDAWFEDQPPAEEWGPERAQQLRDMLTANPVLQDALKLVLQGGLEQSKQLVNADLSSEEGLQDARAIQAKMTAYREFVDQLLELANRDEESNDG